MNRFVIFNNFLGFTFAMFVFELCIGTVTLWGFVNLLNMESSWVSAHNAISFHMVQLIIRYLFLSPMLNWCIFKYFNQNIFIKIILSIVAVTSHVFLIGFIVAGVWKTMTFDNEIAEGLSIWIEILTTSIVAGIIFFTQRSP